MVLGAAKVERFLLSVPVCFFVVVLLLRVLSVVRFRHQFALQFRCQFRAAEPAPSSPCLLARLFFLRSVVAGANFVSLETGKERTRREESAEGTEEEADPAEVAPLYRRERIK